MFCLREEGAGPRLLHRGCKDPAELGRLMEMTTAMDGQSLRVLQKRGQEPRQHSLKRQPAPQRNALLPFSRLALLRCRAAEMECGGQPFKSQLWPGVSYSTTALLLRRKEGKK